MKPSTKIFMAISGVLLIAAGIIIMINPSATMVSLVWVLGIAVLASGISTLLTWIFGVHVFFNGSAVLFSAIGEILVGILLLGHDLFVADAIPFIFGIWILVKGLDIAIHSFDFKLVYFKPWWVLLIIGLASAALGVCSLIKPVVGSSLISILLGLGIVLDGVYYIVALFGINKLEQKVKGFFGVGEQKAKKVGKEERIDE